MQTGPSEEQIHLSIAQYLFNVLPNRHDNLVLWTTIEMSNQQGGWKGKVKQDKLKKKGAKKGWPDIQIFWNDGQLRGLCLEVKKKGGYLSHEQKFVHEELLILGIPTETVRSIDDTREAIIKHNVPNRGRL